MSTAKIKMGPEPTLINRKEVDALYDILNAVSLALKELQVDYIVTGGSLLGAIRQQSILFCDDDIDIAILEKPGLGSGENNNTNTNTTTNTNTNSNYHLVRDRLQDLLGENYIYQIRPWEGGDKIRSKRCPSVFLDLFTIRRYQNMKEMKDIIGMKKNGCCQSDEYINTLFLKMKKALACNASHSTNGNEIKDKDNDNDNDNDHDNDNDNNDDVHHKSLFPCWHFNTRKAIEMWVKEIYRDEELYPLMNDLKMGPLRTNIYGPRCPLRVLKRAFGEDCFHVYYQSGSHHDKKQNKHTLIDRTMTQNNNNNNNIKIPELKPLIAGGGTWENGAKAALLDEHYIPMQPIARNKRLPTTHCRAALNQYLKEQTIREEAWLGLGLGVLKNQNQNHDHDHDVVVVEEKEVVVQINNNNNNNNNNKGQQQNLYDIKDSEDSDSSSKEKEKEKEKRDEEFISVVYDERESIIAKKKTRPRRTIYMDGVFDLFHVGHLEAIRQCADLGDRVIIGITGDEDATGYKRSPVMNEANRIAIVMAIYEVDYVICPCPLIVTKSFMVEHSIDLVVHGFASDADEAKQYPFFKVPIDMGKFKRIGYYNGLSTTDIISKIKTLP